MPKKPHLATPYPCVAAWVRGHGWIEIGEQEGDGFVARALDAGGLVHEDLTCRTLEEAMQSLEKGLEELLRGEGALPRRGQQDRPVGRLRNLDPRSAGWLAEFGIRTRADLQQVGPVAAYRLVRDRHPGCGPDLLFALYGALADIPWGELPAETKERLKREADREDPQEAGDPPE